MLIAGQHAPGYIVSQVKHDLRHDIECTMFSIGIPIIDAETKSVILCGNGKPFLQYIQFTVWRNIPDLVNGSRVRLLSYNHLKPFRKRNKKGFSQVFFSSTAEIEILKDA
jgi:hypothetical protein